MEKYLKYTARNTGFDCYYKYKDIDKYIRISCAHNSISEIIVSTENQFISCSEEEWESHYNATLAYLGIPGTISKFQENFLKRVTTNLGEPLIIKQQVEDDVALTMFNEFWEVYPRKRDNEKPLRIDKVFCKEYYLDLVKSDVSLHSTIIKTIEYIKAIDVKDNFKFTKGTVNFLKGKTWENYTDLINSWESFSNEITGTMSSSIYKMGEDD